MRAVQTGWHRFFAVVRWHEEIGSGQVIGKTQRQIEHARDSRVNTCALFNLEGFRHPLAGRVQPEYVDQADCG